MGMDGSAWRSGCNSLATGSREAGAGDRYRTVPGRADQVARRGAGREAWWAYEQSRNVL